MTDAKTPQTHIQTTMKTLIQLDSFDKELWPKKMDGFAVEMIKHLVSVGADVITGKVSE